MHLLSGLDSDAIVISGNEAIVNQKDQDVMVILTATVNKKVKPLKLKF